MEPTPIHSIDFARFSPEKYLRQAVYNLSLKKTVRETTLFLHPLPAPYRLSVKVLVRLNDTTSVLRHPPKIHMKNERTRETSRDINPSETKTQSIKKSALLRHHQ